MVSVDSGLPGVFAVGQQATGTAGLAALTALWWFVAGHALIAGLT